MLEFKILGPLEVVTDGRPLELGGAKQRALLAVLLLEGGRVVSSDRIVDALWDGTPPPTATASLQNFVSQLRKILGAETIETRMPGYRVRLEIANLDLSRVRRIVDEARVSDPPRRARLLSEALAQWRGEALGEFAYASFGQTEAARLEELRLTLVEEWAEAELAVGRHTSLVADLEKLVAEHPLRERLRGQLMLALYRSGRQAEALDLYRAGRALLISDLGIEPSPLLQRLHASILRHEPSTTPDGTIPPREHFVDVADELLSGRVTIVVGTDAEPLATELAQRFGVDTDRPELARVSQAISILNGSGPLHDSLHRILSTHEPSNLHRFLADLPSMLRRRNMQCPVFVTTGYDLTLEAALLERNEQFDTIGYLATGPHRGNFCHISHSGDATVIHRPNTFAGELALDERSVIVHLRGRLDDSSTRDWESFVVTEDDFIHYGAVGKRLPVAISARLRRTHLLLLGYTLSDWTLRVVLERLWGEEPLSFRSWSVHPAPDPLEREFWRKRDIELIDVAPDEYVAELERVVSARTR